MMKKQGFSLLESLIAAAMFTVGTTIIISLFSTGFIGGYDAEKTSVAMNLAQQRMEEIRNIAFEDIDDEAKAIVTGFSGFQREVDVTESPTDLKQVTVTVYWTHKGDEINVPITTYISRN
jgi:prepilin-type N-terminal cleavage/methylation domain-containing protein